MQNFLIKNLTGEDIETLMLALGELQAKRTRTLMNKIEGQVLTQLKAQGQKSPPPEVAPT